MRSSYCIWPRILLEFWRLVVTLVHLVCWIRFNRFFFFFLFFFINSVPSDGNDGCCWMWLVAHWAGTSSWCHSKDSSSSAPALHRPGLSPRNGCSCSRDGWHWQRQWHDDIAVSLVSLGPTPRLGRIDQRYFRHWLVLLIGSAEKRK